MKFIPAFIVFTFIALASGRMGAQSLFKDANALVRGVDSIYDATDPLILVLDTLELIRTRAIPFDSIQTPIRLNFFRSDSVRLSNSLIKYSSQVLAILDHYRDWTDRESNLSQRIVKLENAFAEGDALGSMLEAIDFNVIREIDPKLLQLDDQFSAYRKTLRTAGQREKILQLLNSESSVSPLEYISVARVLEDYQSPPLPLVKFAEASAEGSNQNVANGIVNQQALIVGLFTFLVERAQEEVVFTFLNRLLGEKGIQQFREVFPKTSLAFKDLNFTYSESFLERLRQAFYEDVQLLSVSLPSLLTNPDYFQLLESDPIAYNFLQLYTMMAMSQREVPLSEIIPLTYRNLFDRYEDEKKAINLKIAKEYHQYSEYQYLAGMTQEILDTIIKITSVLDDNQDNTLQDFQGLFMEEFKVNVKTSNEQTGASDSGSTDVQDSPLIEEVSVTGMLRSLKEEKALYRFLEGGADGAKPISVNLFLGIKDLMVDDIKTLELAKDKELFFNKRWLGGKLPKAKEDNFLKFAESKTNSSEETEAIEKLPIMVFLENHKEANDEYLKQLLEAQPSLRAVKFGFGRDRTAGPDFCIVGFLKDVPLSSVTSLADNSVSTDQGIKAVNIIASHMARLPQQISPFQFFLRNNGKFRMQYRREEFTYNAKALESLRELSNTLPFPADTVPVLAKEYQNLQAILDGKKERSEREYSLKMLPSLLKAKLDPVIANSWSTLKTYDKFLRNPLSEQQLRAAGLALTRNLNGVWYKDMTIVDMLHQWQSDVVNYRNELKLWKATLFPETQLLEDLAAYKASKEQLIQLIEETQAHYPTRNQNETFAFQVLKGILNDQLFLGKTVDQDSNNDEIVDREWITQGELEIAAVEDRLFELHRKLVAKAPEKRATSPVLEYLEKKRKLDALQKVPYQIDDLELLLRDLQLQLDKLDRRTASMETKALKSISPIVQITETLAHLMYAIKDDADTTGWINKDTLNLALFSPTLKPVFTGLLNQQLGQIKTKGSLSLPGVTEFIKLTVQDLDFVTSKEITPDSIKLGFFRTAAFVNLTLNRLLQLPLFVDQTRPDRSFSLIDKYIDLRPIPDLSDQALEFIYYANVKDHRHAMSSVIRLFTQLSEVIDERRVRDTIELNRVIAQLMADSEMAVAGVKRIDAEMVKKKVKETTQVPAKEQAENAIELSDEAKELIEMKRLAEAEVQRTQQLLVQKKAEKARRENKKIQKKAKKSKAPDVLAFLRDYGDFMADLIDADTSTDVNALLRSFADPPGSSQEKRRNYVTANLNGYVGVLAGYESLSGGPLKNNESYATFAPTIPVGISFSKLSGEGKKAQSYSLFLSILDLGSLTTYSLDGNVAGESQISFKNVLKPGLQFHWNIKNSPFFLGAGAQLGPQIREFNGTSTQLNSAQFFINFGVDVVVKRLFKLENKPPGKNGGS